MGQMNDAVVVFLVFWIPNVTACTLITPLFAERKGRSVWEGLVLGLLGGTVGLVVEWILPGRSELEDVRPMAALPPRIRTEAERRRRIGWSVFGGLAALTAVEYLAAITIGKNVPVLAIFALPKAVLIVVYFMRISAAWSAEH